MSPEEIRATALQNAVSLGIVWSMEEPNAIIALARRFEEYIDGPIEVPERPAGFTLITVPGPEEVMRSLTENAHGDLWGAACARSGCGHAQGLHGVGGCHYPPNPTHPNYCECIGYLKEAPREHPDA